MPLSRRTMYPYIYSASQNAMSTQIVLPSTLDMFSDGLDIPTTEKHSYLQPQGLLELDQEGLDKILQK